jgi:hypothetical protein
MLDGFFNKKAVLSLPCNWENGLSFLFGSRFVSVVSAKTDSSALENKASNLPSTAFADPIDALLRPKSAKHAESSVAMKILKSTFFNLVKNSLTPT